MSSAPVESEPEDPLVLIEKHKGADLTLREGDKNTLSLPYTHTQNQVQSYYTWAEMDPPTGLSQ